MEYLIKNEPEDANSSKPEHDFRLAEIIIHIGTTKITSQILECSLCEKNFYLGHSSVEHYLIPVTKESYAGEQLEEEPIDLGTISNDEDYSNEEHLEPNDSDIFEVDPELAQSTEPENVSTSFSSEEAIASPAQEVQSATRKTDVNSPVATEQVLSKNYQCFDCEKSFVRLKSYNAHILKHYTESNAQVTPPAKAENVGEMKRLDAHQSKISASQDELLCTLCGMKFSSLAQLKRHSKVHPGEFEKGRKKLVCGICGRQLADKSSMEQHMAIHLDLKNFKCDYCGRMFRQRNNLIRHNRIHTGEKPHLCSICGKGFYDKTDLTRHFRIHTGEKPYKCNVCERTFSTPGKLKGHKNTHSGAASVECDICKKKLSCNYTLKSHMIIHTGASSSVCTVCGKVFAKNHKLKRHMMTHTGEKPFICIVCGNRFRNRYNMNEHMKIHDREKVKQQLQVLQPPSRLPPTTASSKNYYDVTNEVLDGEVEHHVHLPSHIKIGILQSDRKFNINGDFIEINYGHEIQIGLARDMESLGIPPTALDLQSIQPADDDDDEQTGLEGDCNLSVGNL